MAEGEDEDEDEDENEDQDEEEDLLIRLCSLRLLRRNVYCAMPRAPPVREPLTLHTPLGYTASTSAGDALNMFQELHIRHIAYHWLNSFLFRRQTSLILVSYTVRLQGLLRCHLLETPNQRAKRKFGAAQITLTRASKNNRAA